MTLVALLAVVSVDAQVFVGGSVNVEAEDNKRTETTSTKFSIEPEIGYMFNDKWGVGVKFGYGQSGKGDGKTTTFRLGYYLRYSYATFDKVNLFLDGGGMAENEKVKANDYKDVRADIGFKPGVSVNLTDRLSFVAHLGFIGWNFEGTDKDGDDGINTWRLSFDATQLNFGLYYNF